MVNSDDDDVLGDRRALEAVVGHSLDEAQWPIDAMPPGTRVRVVKDPAWDGPWLRIFTGTIDRTLFPQLVRNAAARPGEREYSVRFDEPQLDIDGDGPYRKAVIWDRYLELV